MVKSWAMKLDAASAFLSVVTVLELEQGILLIERRDHRQGAMLRAWIENLLSLDFAGRILPVDLSIARRCAPLHVPDPLEDRDSLIAATALVHGMTVVTRNTAHFQHTGVALLNPWK